MSQYLAYRIAYLGKITPKVLATIFLVLMSIQIIPLEGQVVSWMKVIAMGLSPFLLFKFSPYYSEACKWSLFYIAALLISVWINRDDFRFTSFFYRIGGIFSFVLYYNLVYINGVFSKRYFWKIVKGLIIAYGIVLIIQQLTNVIIAHGNGFLLFNLIPVAKRSILCGNSLSLEPSHSARILGALFIAFFRIIQIKHKSPLLTLRAIWRKDRKVLLLFLWTMLTMDSGTAFIVLAILCLLLVKEKFILLGIPFFLGVFMAIAPTLDFTPLNRVVASASAFKTGDSGEIQKADLSASARIVPFIYTYQNLDLSSFDQWFGQGIDTAKERDEWGVFQFIGAIDDYGILAYILSLLLFFKCCIRRIVSVETIFFIVVMMAELGNVYYVWSISMLFASIKYYYSKRKERVCKEINNEGNRDSRTEGYLFGHPQICR